MCDKRISFEEAKQVIREGNVRVLKKFLLNGLDPNEKDQYGNTLLSEAVSYGSDEILAELLSEGIEIDKCYNGFTLLSYAVRASNFDNVCLLIINGVDVNKCNDDGTDPLCEALQGERFEIADFLLKSGAKYDTVERGINFLTDLSNIPVQTMDLLVNSGLDINYQDVRSKFGTLLNWAVAKKNSDFVAMLLSLGADPNMICMDGMPALHHAVLNDASAEVVRQLIDAGAEVNAIDEYGNTPLHYLVMKNCNDNAIRVLNALLQSGADPQKKNACGETSYQITSRKLANNTNARVMWTIKSYH